MNAILNKVTEPAQAQACWRNGDEHRLARGPAANGFVVMTRECDRYGKQIDD
jgi:hypothetical protein